MSDFGETVPHPEAFKVLDPTVTSESFASGKGLTLAAKHVSPVIAKVGLPLLAGAGLLAIIGFGFNTMIRGGRKAGQ